jgi:hypothetical protein
MHPGYYANTWRRSFFIVNRGLSLDKDGVRFAKRILVGRFLDIHIGQRSILYQLLRLYNYLHRQVRPDIWGCSEAQFRQKFTEERSWNCESAVS